jgi:16S rRNA (cytosine1402-N4)-methyltransferase
MHYSVMLAETLEYLAIRPDGVYVDATAGLGGHTGAIAERLSTGMVISADRDAESLEQARQNTTRWGERIRFVQSRFSGLAAAVAELAHGAADGLVWWRTWA